LKIQKKNSLSSDFLFEIECEKGRKKAHFEYQNNKTQLKGRKILEPAQTAFGDLKFII